MSKTSAPDFVSRPFAGLPGEADWVALREIVPSATATVRTTAEHGSREVTIVTSLPESWPALHRLDGAVLVALQTNAGSGDPSRDIAATLLAALELEPGTPVLTTNLPEAGPRLQDVLELDGDLVPTVHDDFDYWLDPTAERTDEITRSLEDAASTIVETVKLDSVPSAYWCRMGRREFLRWAFAYDEEKVLDGIARLHARRASSVAGGKFVGAFRACGISIPVWELPRGTEAADVETAAAEFLPGFRSAVESEDELTADERRARAGVVARQVTLR